MVWAKKLDRKKFDDNLQMSIFMQKRINELLKEIKHIDSELLKLKTMKSKLQQDIADYRSEKIKLGFYYPKEKKQNYPLKGFNKK